MLFSSRRLIPPALALFALGAAALSSASALANLPTQAPTVGPLQPMDAIDYVTGSSTAQSVPSVAFDGTNYSVAWGAESWNQAALITRVARLSPAGVALDPEPATLLQSEPYYQQAAVGGVRWLIGGGDGTLDPVTGTRLDANNDVLGTTPIPTGGFAYSASASGDHLVVGYFANDAAGVYVYDSSGTVVASNPSLLATNENGAVVAAGPNGFLLATGTGVAVYGYDLSLVATVPLPTTTIDPVFAAAGANDYLLLLGDLTLTSDSLEGLRITQAGKLEDAAPIPLTSNFYADFLACPPATAAWNGSAWQVAWVTEQGSGGATEPDQIETEQLAPDGGVTPAATVATMDGVSGAVGLGLTAGPAGQTLVTWAGSIPDEVLAERLGPTGASLDATPITLSTTQREETNPAVAHGQNGYLAVWLSADVGLLARRFDDSGTPLDATPILVASNVPLLGTPQTYSQEFQVTAGGDEYFVSWANGSYGGVRVGTDGTVRDASPLSLPGLVVAGGGGQFVAFDGVGAVLLDASGHQVGAPVSLPTTDSALVASLTGAWNGSSFELAWVAGVDAQTFQADTGLLAPSGTLTTLPALATNTSGVWVAAAPTASGDVLLWYATTTQESLELVDPTGAVIGTPVSLEGTVTASPSISSDAAGRSLVTWETGLGDNTTAHPAQAVTVDFTSSPPAVGTPFTLGPPSYSLGYAVASDGVSGRSLFVTSSTTSLGPGPRANYQTVLVPLAPASSPDGGVDGGVDGGEDAGVDAGDDGGVAIDGGAGGEPDAGDAGGGPGANGASPGGTASSSAGCGCSTAPGGGDAGSIAFALLAAGVIAGRARKRWL